MHTQDSSLNGKDVPIPITSVSILTRPGGEAQVEGDDSPTVRIVAHDTFRPLCPQVCRPCTQARAETFVDLIWAPVTDADLADTTSIATRPTAPSEAEFDLVKSPSFRDNAVASGKTYSIQSLR